jgi:hypothetical protein
MFYKAQALMPLLDVFGRFSRPCLKKLPAERVILDGEIAALDEKGRSPFQLLQMFKSSGDVPLVYYALIRCRPD